MSNNRRDISYIEDIVEEAFGECSEQNLEIAKLLFNYIIEEIKIKSDTLGYKLPHVGTLYNDYYLYKWTKKPSMSEEEERFYINRIGDMDMFADSIGGTSRTKKLPYVVCMERELKRKFELGSSSIFGLGKIPPLYLAAIERLQNNNYKEHLKNNE